MTDGKSKPLWKPLVFAPDCYEVSEYGDVRSLYRQYVNAHGNKVTQKEKVIRSFLDRDGYLIVRLSIRGKSKLHKVHRLVLATFSPNENYEDMHVDHVDMDKANNHYSNLEWVTNAENTRRAHAKTDSYSDNLGSRLSDGMVRAIIRGALSGMKYSTLAKKFCTKEKRISSIVNGKTYFNIWKEFLPEIKVELERRSKSISISNHEILEFKKLYDMGFTREEASERMGISQYKMKQIYKSDIMIGSGSKKSLNKTEMFKVAEDAKNGLSDNDICVKYNTTLAELSRARSDFRDICPKEIIKHYLQNKNVIKTMRAFKISQTDLKFVLTDQSLSHYRVGAEKKVQELLSRSKKTSAEKIKKVDELILTGGIQLKTISEKTGVNYTIVKRRKKELLGSGRFSA